MSQPKSPTQALESGQELEIEEWFWPPKRSAKDIIDDALRDNRFSERLLYGFACMFVGVGLAVLIWAMLEQKELAALAGSMATILFWPAMRAARQTRRENIAIRLLEAPLERADTTKEAAELLQWVFRDLIREGAAKAVRRKGST